ncbi:glycosyltransferase family 4 protein [Rhodococcus daqingensis]|uniref:Glycosyltransferase family 4 protein n=1 Tax=Rhodococcus daqingensis TaxID=2479363 RepID=A0ABW2RRP9_9NOCA
MSAMERTLFVSHTGQVSGAEKVLLALVEEALRGGREVLVACPDGPLADALAPGCVRLSIPALGLSGESGAARALGAARMLARWVAAARVLASAARVPGTGTVVNSLFALPAVRLARVPGAASWLVHDTVTSAKQRAVIRLGRAGIRRAVAVSEATARPLRALGLPVLVAQNGVRWPVPAVTGEVHRPPVVGALALLTPWKGHRVLLEAVALLPGVRLELAGGHFPGDEDYVAELHTRAQRPDLAGRVRFLGHVRTGEVLEGWDAVVSASVQPEAGPLSVLEAMSYGVPVIGTDHGGTSEFLCGGAGLLVAPGDPEAMASAITRVLSDGELRERLTATARARVAAEHDISITLPAMLRTLTA